MRRRALLLGSVVALASAGVADAASDRPALPPPAQFAVPQPAVQPAQRGFMADFFSARKRGEAQSDPVSILPPAAQKPAAVLAPVAPKASAGTPVVMPPPAVPPQVAAAPQPVVVPRPRLRPAYQPEPAAVAAAEKPTAPRIVGPVVIDLQTTGSVAEAPAHAEPAPPPPAPQPPAPAQAAEPAPPPAVVVAASPDRDDLLGDPGSFVAPPSSDSDPRLSAPTAVGQPLPRPAAPRGAPAMPPILPGEPYELVRTLQAIQDRLAQGATDALPAQQTLRTAIERAFAAAPPAVWQERRNDLAAVTYVLSGGSPEVLRKLAALDPKPPIDPNLVTGVLAYAEGREKEALALLGPIDAMELPPSMGAQLAIAQSALAVRSDPQKAMRLLAVARLVAPGTLAEEAAIRRQIFIADQLKDDKTVQSLARQYLDRFRHSVYAGNFRMRFAAALSHMDFINDEAAFTRLDDMLASLEPAGKVQLYLTVALASAIKSRTVAARLASERALALADPLSAEQARGKLYHAAALVASAKTFDAAVAEAGSVDRKLLSPADLALLDVVGATIASLRSATERPRGTIAAPPTGTPDKEIPPMKRAADALKAVDTLLAAVR